jgi:predicted anti-sigma-YlaC factor YlaD
VTSKKLFAVVLVSMGLLTGCSVRRMAINRLGDALASQGTTFSSENDPELVRAAAPFSLKLMESLLAESPNHAGLLTAAASGFTQFSYAFVQQDADEMENKDFEAAEAIRARARLLYLRARDYGLRGLGLKHPRFEQLLRADAKKAAKLAGSKDVPLLYWTGAAWAAAISLSKDRPDLVAELPLVEALMDRALALDEGYGSGAIHTFFISYEMSRPGGAVNAAARSREHFDRAMTLSQGLQAGPMVALAEAVCVQNQDLKEFESLLHRALAVNIDARPEWRLANLVTQRRAKWLLGRTDELFLRAAPTSPNAAP